MRWRPRREIRIRPIVSPSFHSHGPRADSVGTIEIQYGARGASINYAESFVIAPPVVAEAPAPVPSGSFQKRRSIESQHKFDCPAGHTFCWTGERQQYTCMDTSSDVTGMSLLLPLSFLPRFIFHHGLQLTR